MDFITISISIFSTLIAVIAVWISTKTLNEQRRISKISSNYALLSQTSSMIVANPKLLELHNISLDTLKQINVSEQEVVYVLQSIIAAETYYEIENPKIVDYKTFSDFRKNILLNKKVRLIWTSFMREKLVFVSPFVLAVDDFYKNNPTTD